MIKHDTFCLATYIPAERPAGPAPTITISNSCNFYSKIDCTSLVPTVTNDVMFIIFGGDTAGG